MNQTINFQKLGTEKEAREQLKLRLTQHLAQESKSTQVAHKWMKGLELAGVGIIVAAFINAMYVSISWKSINPLMIPVAWFAFATSISPTLIFLGLDAIILRAFPTVILPGKAQKFVTGSGAVWVGIAFIMLALAAASFWGYFAYATWTLIWALLTPMITFLGVAMGVMIVISMLLTTIQQLTRSR